MSRVLHLAAACLLLASHALFFLRGLAIQRGTRAPRAIDRAARTLSQVLLPLTAGTGAILLVTRPEGLVPHGLIGLSPLAAIPLVFGVRLLLRRRTELPWLLPALNLALIVAALLTGMRTAIEAGRPA
jgi:hypothetical protein